MIGREYSDGLQQAIQAKENVVIKEETVTMATITYQNFFRLYKKLSGDDRDCQNRRRRIQNDLQYARYLYPNK